MQRRGTSSLDIHTGIINVYTFISTINGKIYKSFILFSRLPQDYYLFYIITLILFLSSSVSFCTFLAHEFPDQIHKMVMINGGGPTALEPSLCSIFNLPTCVLHCLSPLLAWSFLK